MTCLCQFPMRTYINQTVFKTSELSHLAFEFIHLAFCMLYQLLRMEEEKNLPSRGGGKETSSAPEEEVTQGHKCEQGDFGAEFGAGHEALHVPTPAASHPSRLPTTLLPAE